MAHTSSQVYMAGFVHLMVYCALQCVTWYICSTFWRNVLTPFYS